VVVWPHSSPMAGAVRRALEYDAGFGITACTWTAVPSDASGLSPLEDVVVADEASSETRLERRLHEWGVVGMRRNAIPANVTPSALCPGTLAGSAGDLRVVLRRRLASWSDEGVFVVPGSPRRSCVAFPDTAGQWLGTGCDTVLFATPPTPQACHVVGGARDAGWACLEWRTGTHSTRLKTVDLSACRELTAIGFGAFSGCPVLQTVTFPPGLQQVHESALSSCPALVAVDLSACTVLRNIDRWAFCRCVALRTVAFPPSLELLEELDALVLFGCPNLAAVDLSACVALKEIGSGVLSECAALETVTFPPALELLHDKGVLCYCSKLAAVDFSACRSLRAIGDSSFSCCAALETVDLSACLALELIGVDAFQNCAVLKRIVLPPGLELLEHSAFRECPKLTDIDFSACGALCKIGDRAVSNCGALRTVDLRGCRALRRIGDRAFEGCAALERVVLPPGFNLPSSSSVYGLASTEAGCCSCM